MTLKHFSIVQQGMMPWYNLKSYVNTMNYECASLAFPSDTLIASFKTGERILQQISLLSKL